MGSFLSITNDLTREDILNEYFECDDGSIVDIASPLEINDIPTNIEASQCKICNRNVALFSIIPCQHRCICNECLKQIYEGQMISLCPYPECNKRIKQII